MAVVVDASLLVVLSTADERRPAARAQFAVWDAKGEALHAPWLIRYEIANAFTRLVAANAITKAAMMESWEKAAAIPVVLHELADGPEVVKIAVRLGRQSAYDAAYIALATELDTELWTVDGPLARNAAGAGLPVRLVAS